MTKCNREIIAGVHHLCELALYMDEQVERSSKVSCIAIVVTGFVTAYTLSVWPDMLVGLGIALLNADVAREVWTAARAEHKDAKT